MDIFKELDKVNEARCIDGFKMQIQDWDISKWGLAIAGECGEMCNVIKKINRGDFKDNPAIGHRKLAKEMADQIIYLHLFSKHQNIDLPSAIKEKFNEVSDRVGSKIKID